jgi:hypothetical protein
MRASSPRLCLPAAPRRQLVELRHRQGQPVRLRADLVAGEQAAIAVEGGVFHGLGRQRRRQLLEARHGAQLQVAADCFAAIEQQVSTQPALQDVQGRVIDRVEGGCGQGDGVRQQLAIGGRHAALAGIGAIDREMHQQLGHAAPNRHQRQVARLHGTAGERMQAGGERIEFSGKVAQQEAAPRLPDHAVDVIELDP